MKEKTAENHQQDPSKEEVTDKEQEKEKQTNTKADIETPAAQLFKLQKELSEQKEKYLRLLAENENIRKRMQKEKQEMTRFAIENLIAEFLIPLDNLENALGFAQNASDETKNWAMGFEMILTQFKDLLSTHHVTPFHSEGTLFDPHRHEAIEMEETEKHAEGTIIQEFVKGYQCGDRILRPAKVKVAKCPPDKSQKEEGNLNKE